MKKITIALMLTVAVFFATNSSPQQILRSGNSKAELQTTTAKSIAGDSKSDDFYPPRNLTANFSLY